MAFFRRRKGLDKVVFFLWRSQVWEVPFTPLPQVLFQFTGLKDRSQKNQKGHQVSPGRGTKPTGRHSALAFHMRRASAQGQWPPWPSLPRHTLNAKP